jgi:FtsZ-binding cell division protein ZapB
MTNMSWKRLFWQTEVDTPKKPAPDAKSQPAAPATAPPLTTPQGTAPITVPPHPAAVTGPTEAELATLLRTAAPTPATGSPPPVNGAAAGPAPEASPASSDDGELLLDVTPDTDDLQQLEMIVAKLEALPGPSRVAAAGAAMAALGKDARQVISQAEQRLARTREKMTERCRELTESVAKEHETIAMLQARIEEHRTRIAQLTQQRNALQSSGEDDETRIQKLRALFATS